MLVCDNMRRTRSLTDVTDSGDEDGKVVIGICAMDKKAKSNPMDEILRRLTRHGEFTVRIFGDEMILNHPVEEWPYCDCLFSWHSEHFPLGKAEKYVNLRQPFVINDVSKQKFLRDRRKVYAILKDAEIPLPFHIVVSRDDLLPGEDPDGFLETADYVEMNGVRICKPFVEKPVSGDNHNINIYYPQQKGGGVKCLFRKYNNRSAEYLPNHPGNVRRDGSYIYEEFLTTGGTDVKVYTVGPRYAHAEARKSPVVDGVVLRTPEGKEVRFPVVLDQQEKEIATAITLAFGQKVCGFDLLRSEKGPYVCDVNGWSFVKSSYKYYEDAAGILRIAILGRLAPHKLAFFHRHSLQHAEQSTSENHMTRDPASYDDLNNLSRKNRRIGGGEKRQWEELRCVLMVARHGDRTPKQKMKIVVKEAPFLELFEKYKDSEGSQATLKAPAQLQDLLDVTRSLLKEMTETQQPLPPVSDAVNDSKSESKSETSDSEKEARDIADEYREKLRIIVTVLEAGGHFSGINRKVQLKPVKWSLPAPDSSERPHAKEVLLILKHGGTLTHSGRQQAEQFGRHFRTAIVCLSEGQPTSGLLRLHSTYRHDLKIYSSDEGRVQTSAAAFAKGLLDLEGTSLTPILVSLVQKDTGMLDSFDKGASEDIQTSKTELYSQMTWNKEKQCSMRSPSRNVAVPTPPSSPPGASGGGAFDPDVQESGPLAGDPGWNGFDTDADEMADPDKSSTPSIPDDCLELLYKLVDLIKKLVDQLYSLCLNEKTDIPELQRRPYSSLSQDPTDWEEPNASVPCTGERLLLMYDRWRKLSRSFYNEKKDQFDISKVPDIYDSAKYDAIHNGHLNLDLEELYDVSRILGNLVIPSEYGIDRQSKFRIGVGICSQVLGKLLVDLANTREESLVAAKILNQSMRKRDWLNSHRNMDFGDTGFFDDFYLTPTQIQDEAIGAKPNANEAAEGSSLACDSPKESSHRLCPTYAMNINSPLRHVRTRIYFTSESHIHALMNVLKYCRIKGCEHQKTPEIDNSILDVAEYDYLSHLVFRLYENPQLPIDDESRFRVEVLFSPGAAYNPFEKRRENARWLHVLPIKPRMKLHCGNGMTLKKLEEMLQPFSAPRKVTQPFAWLTSQQRN